MQEREEEHIEDKNNNEDNNNNEQQEQNIDQTIQELEEINNNIEREIEEIQDLEMNNHNMQPQRERKQNQVMNISNLSQPSYNCAITTYRLDTSYEPILARIMICLVQTYSLNKGIKKFSNKGEDAAFNEMDQLHKRICFKPRMFSSLTQEEINKALDSLIFLTEKRDG